MMKISKDNYFILSLILNYVQNYIRQMESQENSRPETF